MVEEFWTVIGFPWHEIIWKERWGTPTVHLSCDFSKPSFFGDRLTFRLTILKVGKSSVRISHTVHCGEEFRWSGEQVLAASHLIEHTSMVWPTGGQGKTGNLPSGRMTRIFRRKIGPAQSQTQT